MCVAASLERTWNGSGLPCASSTEMPFFAVRGHLHVELDQIRSLPGQRIDDHHGNAAELADFGVDCADAIVRKRMAGGLVGGPADHVVILLRVLDRLRRCPNPRRDRGTG